jgi:hypothetical protein
MADPNNHEYLHTRKGRCGQIVGGRHCYLPPDAAPHQRWANAAKIDSPETHPWLCFLDARVDVMRWMRDEEHYTDEQIASTLSMDAGQVREILAYKGA